VTCGRSFGGTTMRRTGLSALRGLAHYTGVADRTPRIDYVDGLRALALLTVLAACVAFHSPYFRFPVARTLLEGSRGADLFFVLAAFCLAYPTLRKWSAAAIAAGQTLRAAPRRRIAGNRTYDEWPPLPPLPDGASGLARHAPRRG
jgi:hypothetical protein